MTRAERLELGRIFAHLRKKGGMGEVAALLDVPPSRMLRLSVCLRDGVAAGGGVLAELGRGILAARGRREFQAILERNRRGCGREGSRPKVVVEVEEAGPPLYSAEWWEACRRQGKS